MTSNQIALAKVHEDAWYHEADIRTRNVQNQISAEKNMIGLMEAQTAQYNAQIRAREADIREREIEQNLLLSQSRLQEEARHNQAMEAETYRSNTVKEYQNTAQRQDSYTLGTLQIQQKERESVRNVESQEKRSVWQLGGGLLNTIATAAKALIPLI